ncbi:MAG: class I SAM-dependent methyltransferase, partial [Pseudomonadales bacterium]|nr:class I SAM-dependent methyltransferase [Pseudomonadales bacterium]
GVGGSTVTTIMGAILKTYAGDSIDFLLCPANGVFEVREYLIEERVSLMDEWIVSEKGRQYEVIYIRVRKESDGYVKVPSVGNMWDINDKEHQAYLKKIIAHYQRAALGDDAERSKIILEEYRGIYE